MTVSNLLDFPLRCSELEIRSDIIAQLVFHTQVLPPDVLIRITIGKYAAGLGRNNDCTNPAQNLLNRL
jgi:hypothetical protein